MFCPVCKTKLAFIAARGSMDWIEICPKCGRREKEIENKINKNTI